jgi:hypothetical protein|uniref:Uncharacterized protein n=1 Tax=Siphoviridae sp. ctKRD15 TaxID=2825441 RepID=A0A8S5V5K2_9CAUD|nr:MAG TPA: Protein of unknown function (DUF1617) [Siphoviridae sp. ctKRD15]
MTAMKTKLKNSVALERLHSLKPFLSRRDKIGYVAARNYRFLSNSITEFETIRLSLIEKYGVEGKDERGAPTYTLKMDSPNFKNFCDELAPFNEMEHEVELMTAKYDEVAGNLSGEEILAIDWMLED